MTNRIKTAKLEATLQSHQEQALKRSRNTNGIVLSHGLGSGKTVTSLAIAEDRGGKVLVICPASLEANFRKEINRFVSKDRRSAYKIISYAKFRRDPEGVISRHRPNTLIADEYHRTRNPGKTRKALKTVRSKVPFMVGLTASLTNNHPADAIRLINLAADKRVIGREEFERNHIDHKVVKPSLWGRIKGVKPGEVPYVTGKKALKQRLSPYVDHFPGSEEYRKNLPEKEVRRVEVEMNKRQQTLMKFLEGRNPALAYKVRKNLPPNKQEASELNTFLVGMRQVANDPSSHDEGEKTSPKIERMVEDIQRQRALDPDFKGITYSRYLDSGSRPVVDRVGGKMYEGKVSKKKRAQMVRDYNAGKLNHMGISPAGGEGIDLKGTRMIQVMEPDWNPETIEQAIGRGVRYKSHEHLPEDKRKVVVNKYVSVKPKKWYQSKRQGSVDEYLERRSMDKKKLNDDFMSVFGKTASDQSGGRFKGFRGKLQGSFLGRPGFRSELESRKDRLAFGTGLNTLGDLNSYSSNNRSTHTRGKRSLQGSAIGAVAGYGLSRLASPDETHTGADSAAAMIGADIGSTVGKLYHAYGPKPKRKRKRKRKKVTVRAKPSSASTGAYSIESADDDYE